MEKSNLKNTKIIIELKNLILINQQELKLENGRYVGQVLNGLREGKGIYYVNNGDRYEGEWKNDIEYFQNGDIYEGEHRNGQPEGK